MAVNLLYQKMKTEITCKR